jgi:thiamine biosynthesis protein ThiI
MMRMVCLMSGGIDSPVAANLMASRGAEVLLLHMDNFGERDPRILGIVEDLAEVLRESTGTKMPLFMAPYWRMQERIRERCDRRFQCVLCKRYMLRTARDFAQRNGAEAIVTGDSLGQVASQTLQNILVEQRGLNFPIVRPLIGLDKIEIETIAKRIGTYQVSIRKAPSCPYVPRKPQTSAGEFAMDSEESLLEPDNLFRDLINDIVRVTP